MRDETLTGSVHNAGDAEPPAPGHVLIASLDQRWGKYLKELRRAKRTFSEEAIHDLRVATRRLISTLMILELLIPDERIERMRRRLKRLFDACSPLRDTQVQLLTLAPGVAQHPELETLVTVLKVREQNLIRTIGGKVRKVSTARLSNSIRWLKQRLREQFSHPLMNDAAVAIVHGAAARTFASAVYFQERVNSAQPLTIHRARIAFKKFRYTMEALAPMIPQFEKESLKAMDAYQTRMGVIQDADVLGGVVKHFVGQRNITARRKLAGFQRELDQRKKELIDAYLAQTGEMYSLWQVPSLPKPRREAMSR